MRLQLRSSLVKPAKKVIGKQRLTVLVNVSFPAPEFQCDARFQPRVTIKTLVVRLVKRNPGGFFFYWQCFTAPRRPTVVYRALNQYLAVQNVSQVCCSRYTGNAMEAGPQWAVSYQRTPTETNL